MNLEQVLQSRANRLTRTGRPFHTFFESFTQCVKVGELILSGSVSPDVTPLLERSVVITTVTATEVYYRDILDMMFRYCSPSFFEPHLKFLHPEKFDISDLVEVFRKEIHPLELVSAAQSFQNIDRIDRVYAKFIGSGLWASILKLEARVKNEIEKHATWDKSDLESMKRTFDLRHELVHDPARRAFFTEAIQSDLWATAHMVFGSDLVLSKMLQDNRDPTLETEAEP